MNSILAKVDVVIGQNCKQLLEETTIRLPLDAIKIRNITAKVQDIATEVITGKVIVQGTIHKQVFFVGVDGVVHHIAEDVPFSTFVDVPGAEPGMDVFVQPVIEHVGFHLANSSILVQKIVLKVCVVVTDQEQVNLELGEGPLIKVEEVVAENTRQDMIESTITLANPAIKVSDIRAEIRDVEAEVIEGKVIIQGVLHKQIFYVGESDIEFHQAEDVEFSTFVELPGSQSGLNVEIRPTIEHIFFELLSPTELRQKVVIEFFAKVTRSQQVELVPGQELIIRAEAVRGENFVQTLEESIVTLDNPAIKVKDIEAKIKDITTEVIEDKVIVQGIIHKQIFYVGTDNIERHQAEDIPFSTFVDVPGAEPGFNVSVNPVIEFVSFNLQNATSLLQKVVLEIFVKVTETVQLAVNEVGPYNSSIL